MAANLEIVVSIKQMGASVLGGLNTKINELNNSVTSLAKSIPSVLGVAGGLGGIIGFGRAALKASIESEALSNSVGILVGDMEKGDQIFNKIRDTFINLPISIDDATEAYKNFRIVGMDPTIEQMKTIASISVTTRKSMSDVADMLVRLQGRQLKPFGISIEEIGSNAIVHVANMKKEVLNTNDEIRKAIVELWEKKYQAALEKASQSTAGKMTIIKNNIEENMLEPIGNILTAGGGDKTTGGFVQSWLNTIGSIGQALAYLARTIKEMFVGMFMQINAILNIALNTLIMIGKTIYGVSAQITEFAKRTGTLLKAVVTLDPDLANKAFEGYATQFNATFDKIFNEFGDKNSVAWDKFLQYGRDATNNVYTAYKTMTDKISKTTEEIGSGSLAGGLSGGDNTNKGGKRGIKNKMFGMFQGIDTGITGPMDLIKEKMKELDDVRNTITDGWARTIQENADAQFNAIVENFEIYKQKMEELGQLGMNLGASMAAGIGQGAEGVKESLKATLVTTISFFEKMAQTAFAAAYFWNPPALIAGLAGITFGFEALKKGVDAFQSGTPFAGGGTALIGERGPELVQLPRGSQVFNNSQTRNMVTNNNQPVIVIAGGNIQKQLEAATRNKSINWTRLLNQAGVALA